MDRDDIFNKIRAAGRAALTLGIENSHSGNISIKCADESGRESLAITATGSQKGELTRDKICYPSLLSTNFGHFKASSETDIHAKILQLPGVEATMHGHTRMATVVTLDDDPMPKTNPRRPLLPIDGLGARYLGEVPVDWFAVASGSKEMTDGITSRLADHPAHLVQAHGTFAKGRSLEEAFFHLALTEHAGEVIALAQMLGVDLAKARESVMAQGPWLTRLLPEFTARLDGRRDFEDEPDTIEMFLTQGFRIFESRYSPFHTGSMSIRGSRTLLYLPKASQPHDLAGPMFELPLKPEAGEAAPEGAEGLTLELHRAVYRETRLKAVVQCHPAEALALALALNQTGGGNRVIPIDAEGGFLYPSVPILPANPDPDLLCRALLDYRMAVVERGGVWSAGEQSVGEALRHVSSIKDICFYRIQAAARGLELKRMEPERARSW